MGTCPGSTRSNVAELKKERKFMSVTHAIFRRGNFPTPTHEMKHGDMGVWGDNEDLVITVTLVITHCTRNCGTVTGTLRYYTSR